MSILDLTNEQVGVLGKALEDAGFSVSEITTKMDSLGKGVEKVVENTIRQNKVHDETITLLEGQEDSLKKQGEWAQSIHQINTARFTQEKNTLKMLRDTEQITQDQYKTELLILEAKREQEGHAHTAGQNALGMAQTLTGVSGAWKGTLIGSFFQGDFNANISRAAEALRENFSAANMLGSSLMKVQESTMMMVISADQQFASINKLTGTTGEYNDMIMDTMDSNSQFNVSVEDAAESVGALYTEMSNFSNMSKEAQASAVETTAQLKALGIDAQTSAANFEILNGAMGMSAEQAGEVQKDFAAMAADLGVSAGKIAKDFERNSDVFTAYGDNAVQVFKDTAAAAKATGIEMDALLNITTQFDTFEGAAKAAGQLNAVLGGGLLNSMDLLNATEEERTRMLIGSIEASGKSWQSMSKFEKQAVANAAGIKDMTAANKLFGTSLAEFDAAQEKVEDNAAAQEKLAERAAAATNMQDKLKRIMEQFAVAVQPIINFVHTLLDGLLALNDMTGGMLIPTLIGLLGVYKAWSWWQGRAAAAAAAELVTKQAAAAAALVEIQMKAAQNAAMAANTASTITNTVAENAGTLATTTKSTATALSTAKTQASTLATQLSTVATGSQTVATVGLGTASTGATPGAFGLAKGVSAIGKAAMKYMPALFALGMVMLGLGLAIAAPLILIAVIIWSLKDLVIAFLEVPDAIAPALAGMAAFIGIVSLGLPIIALSIVAFFNILTLAIPAVTALAIHLPVMIVTLMGLGVALWLLGKGIKQFVGDDMPGAMLLAVASLILFGIGLGIAEKFIKMSALKVGLAIGVLGIGLIFLGKGVKEFNDVTWGGIAKMIVSLIVMGVLLKVAAQFVFMSALKVGVAVGVLGLGLLILGKGVKEFNDVTWGGIGKMIVSLIVLGLMLMPAGWALFNSAMIVGVAAMVLGAGLWMLGKGIQEFMDIGPGMMIGLAIALTVFGWALIPAGFALMYGGIMLFLGALFAAPALLLLALAVKPWMDMDFDKLRGLGSALNEMTNGFFWTGFWLMFSGPMLLRGALFAAPALWLLALAVLPWMEMDWNKLVGLGWMLAELGIGLGIAGIALAIAGYPFLLGALLISLGMLILNKPLREFAITMVLLAGVAESLPAVAHGLMVLGWALPGFAFGILMLGIAASLPFFKTGLRTLSRGLQMFASAMSRIPEEKAKALATLFKGMTLFKSLSGVGRIFRQLGWGLAAIGWGLHQMPEGEKVISFSYAADALAKLSEASVGVTAEQVVNVQGLADAARSYAWSSRLMRSSDKDALVAALKEVVGLSKSSGGKGGGKGGQDIVLEIDGKEFARAVDAAIDSKHGLPF